MTISLPRHVFKQVYLEKNLLVLKYCTWSFEYWCVTFFAVLKGASESRVSGFSFGPLDPLVLVKCCAAQLIS